jgi:uncharacterized membrane protein YjjB (DUF3815 family)
MVQITRYAKFIVALLAVVGVTVTTQYPQSSHWLPGLVSAIGATLVYFVPNAQPKL